MIDNIDKLKPYEEIEKELGYKIKGDKPELLKGCCNNEQKLDI